MGWRNRIRFSGTVGLYADRCLGHLLRTFVFTIRLLNIIMQNPSYTPNRRGSRASQKSTSPESFVTLPPSPISSEEPSSNPSSRPSKLLSNIPAAIQLLKDRRGCTLKGNWNSLQLQPGDYDELWLQLKSEGGLLGYIEDKVQYERNSFSKSNN